MERDHLAINRLSRIWAIVEYIAEKPGASRSELAERFALSERQVQDDLGVIREELGFPLVRRKGYRFRGSGSGVALDLSFSEARALIAALTSAALEGSIPQKPLSSLLAKLPSVFPLQLQPLVRRSMQFLGSETSTFEARVFRTLTEALFEQRPVRLRLSSKIEVNRTDPVVEPQLLIPYRDTWYLIGQCRQKRRAMMFKVDSIKEVTLAAK